MSKLGQAYIEVTADLKKFPAELRAKLKAAMKEAVAGVEFTELDRKAEHAGETAAQHVRRGFSRSAKAELLAAGEDGGKHLLSGLSRVFSRNSGGGGGFFKDVGSFFKDVFSQVSSAVQSGFQTASNVGENLGSVFSKIGDVGGQIGSGLKVGFFAVIIPVIIQLAGALVQLGAALFALPAALGVAAAAFAPLIIAFQGFGEAVGAGLSGDVKKFDQALKGLPPSMRSVVREVVGLKGVFGQVKDGIQQAFFTPLVGVVGPAIRSFLGVVGPGLKVIAGDLGKLGAGLLRTFTSPDNLRTFAALLAATDRIVQEITPGVTALAQAMLNLIRPALPFLERGAASFASFGKSVQDFTARISGDNTLSGWLERAGHILGTLTSSLKLFGQYLILLLGGEIGDNATQFLDEFKVKLQELVAFIKSPEGKETIHNLGVILKWVGEIFLFAVGSITTASHVLNFFFNAVRLVLRVLQDLGGGFVGLIQVIGDFLKKAGSAIADFFTKDIPRWAGEAIDWFKSLPGEILDALSGLADDGKNFFIDTLEGWYGAVLEAIGRVIGVFLSTPYLIQQGLAAIPGLLADAGNAILNFFTDLGSSIGHFFTDTLPNLFMTAMTNLGNLLTTLWHDAITGVRNIVVTGFNEVVDFIYSLPGRVAALGSRMYNAAVGLGLQLARGLASIGEFASDLGKKVANALKSSINWVIGRINQGIADIDDKLPIDLPRIPMLARGAVVDTPTLALVGEAGPEVVVPLGNPQRAQQLAEQSGLLSMLRAPGGRTVVNVVAYLDPTGAIIPITKTVVRDTLDEQGDELAYARAA